MTPVTQVHGRAIPFGRDNVDTDQIIAAEQLKTVSRTGLGRHAFERLRAEPGNVFDDTYLRARRSSLPAPILAVDRAASMPCGRLPTLGYVR